MTSPQIKVEEVNLEDLIILGEDKKIPVIIEYPQKGTIIKAKALIKQVTLKEMEKLKLNKNMNPLQTSTKLLENSLFKSNGEKFTHEELLTFPIGVINELSIQIMELSGMKKDSDKELMDF